MIEHPLIGRGSHRHRAYAAEKALERVVVTSCTIDLEQPIERIVLVCDVPVQARCRVVLDLRHAVTLPGRPPGPSYSAARPSLRLPAGSQTPHQRRGHVRNTSAVRWVWLS